MKLININMRTTKMIGKILIIQDSILKIFTASFTMYVFVFQAH